MTDRSWLGNDALPDVVRTLLEAGVTCVQLREKALRPEAFVREARALLPVCHAYGVPLIINDSIEVCLAAGADGVHVGQSDTDVRHARALLGPDRIVGASAHNVQEALQAQQAGADYLGCGAVFGSATKTDAGTLEHSELERICRAVEIPVVAIGGIAADNATQLRGSGICGLAVISALFAAPDKQRAAQQMASLAHDITQI